MATANPQSPEQPVIPIPTFVFNHDVIGILNRIGRFVTELVRCDSSNLSTTTAADQTRLASYLDAVNKYVAYVAAVPVLDLPKTSHAVKWPVEPLDAIPDLDNEDVLDVIHLLTIAHAELANSDSGQSGSGLTSFDNARLTAVITKTQNFLKNYIATASPLDLPASSPMDSTTPTAKLAPAP